MEHATSHQDNLRMIAMPHIFSTEKGRIDGMRRVEISCSPQVPN